MATAMTMLPTLFYKRWTVISNFFLIFLLLLINFFNRIIIRNQINLHNMTIVIKYKISENILILVMEKDIFKTQYTYQMIYFFQKNNSLNVIH